MRVRNDIDVHNVIQNIEHTRRVSDKFVGVGPIGIGLDGILTWLPGIGELYTLGASAYLLAQGVKVRVPGIVLWQMGALFLVDFAAGAVPVVGDTFDMFFCAHLWAGGLLARAIRRTAYIGDDDDTPSTGAVAACDPRVSQAMRDGKRIVLLPKGA
jgi:hypothetical protein